MDTERGKEKIRNVVSGSLWKDFIEIISWCFDFLIT